MVNKLVSIVLLLLMLSMVSTGLADIKIFNTSFGKAQLDVPSELEIKNTNSLNSIQFVLPGSEKPIISIVFDNVNVFGSDLEKYADLHFEEGHVYDKEMTADNYIMHFYNMNDYGGVRSFNGIIDHVQDKNAIVMIFGNSETPTYGITYGWDNIVRFTKDEFLSICKSFTFI